MKYIQCFLPANYIWSALHIPWISICRFNQLQIENIYSRKFQKVKFEFAMPSNYLYSIYIVFISYLLIILSIQEDVPGLNVNTMPIYIRIWELENLGIFRGVPGTNPPQKPRGNCIFFLKGTAPSALFWFFLCNYANKYPAEKGLVLMDNQRQCFLPAERWEKSVVAELQGCGAAAGGPRGRLVSTLRVCWSGPAPLSVVRAAALTWRAEATQRTSSWQAHMASFPQPGSHVTGQ